MIVILMCKTQNKPLMQNKTNNNKKKFTFSILNHRLLTLYYWLPCLTLVTDTNNRQTYGCQISPPPPPPPPRPPTPALCFVSVVCRKQRVAALTHVAACIEIHLSSVAHTHACAHTHTHTHTHTHAHTHTHTHTHTHSNSTQAQRRG